MATKTKESKQSYRRQFGAQLGQSAQRAKWIDSTEDHAEHDGQTLITHDHEVIKRWAEERDAQPATVAGTEHEGRPGVLRFDFPGGSEGRLQIIGWDQWFETFDKRDVAMIFQETLANGNQSNFFRFISPHRNDA